MRISLKKYLKIVSSDLYRYSYGVSFLAFVKVYLFFPGFRYTFWMRTCSYLKRINIIFGPLYIISRFILYRLKYRYGIDIPYNTHVGEGLFVGHFGGIIISSKAIIGKNVNINHGVTIGETFGGKFPGTPVIGDNVFIGPGAFVIGGITVGSKVAIGSNTVVVTSLPDKAVVVAQKGEVVSYKGSDAYVVNTNYPEAN